MTPNLQELLLFYRDSGIDYPLSDVAIDQFQLSESHRNKPTTTAAPKPYSLAINNFHFLVPGLIVSLLLV